jgi:nitrous oxide reductase accessory protein NosL
MVRTVILLMAAVLLLAGCAESLSDQRRGDPISQAASCAMCGASISGGYFESTTDRTLGPGQGW